MELKAYLTILWRRKWVIAITTAVTVVVTFVGTLMMTPVYVASTMLRVASAPGGSASYTDYLYATRLMNTYAKLITSRSVLDELTQRLGLDAPPKVGMEMLGNSELIRLTAEHPNPQLAQEAANTMAEILIDLNRELYVEAEKTTQEILSEQLAQVERELHQARMEYESAIDQSPADSNQIEAAGRALDLKQQTQTTLLEQFQEARVREVLKAKAITVFEPADLPKAPSKPRKMLYVPLGLMVGLIGGLGLSFLFENLDSTLHSTQQIEQGIELPIIGEIPKIGKHQHMVFFNSNSPQQEAFRRLRTKIFALDHDTPLKTLLVASAEPKEGKSTIVANLACAIARSDCTVIVVDADMRQPTLHKLFNTFNETGLSSVLQQEAKLDESVQHIGTLGIWVLSSGPPPPDPGELLGSSQMSALVAELAERFDVVLLDTPSVLAVADAAVLAPIIDGVLLVVERAQSGREAVQAAHQQLLDVRANPVGVVVTRAQQNGSYRYYHQKSSWRG